MRLIVKFLKIKDLAWITILRTVCFLHSFYSIERTITSMTGHFLFILFYLHRLGA